MRASIYAHVIRKKDSDGGICGVGGVLVFRITEDSNALHCKLALSGYVAN